MNKFLVILVLIGVTLAQDHHPAAVTPVPIVRTLGPVAPHHSYVRGHPYVSNGATPIVNHNFDLGVDGSYQFQYTSADGSTREETSVPKNPGTEAESRSVSGSYSYVGDDGSPVTVNYIADEDGYRVSGNIINPAVGGEAVIARQRAIGTLPPTGSAITPVAAATPIAVRQNIYRGDNYYRGDLQYNAYNPYYRTSTANTYPYYNNNRYYNNLGYYNNGYNPTGYFGYQPAARLHGDVIKALPTQYQNTVINAIAAGRIHPDSFRNLPVHQQAALAKDIADNNYHRIGAYYN